MPHIDTYEVSILMHYSLLVWTLQSWRFWTKKWTPWSLENQSQQWQIKGDSGDWRYSIERYYAGLVAAFNASIKTILIHLRQIVKEKKKLNKWVPYELNDRQRDESVKVVLCCITDTETKGILNRDKKWILFG